MRGSEESDREENRIARAPGLDLAAAHDAVLQVRSVVDEDVVTAYSGDEYVDEVEGFEYALEEHGGGTLSELRSRASDGCVDVETAIQHGRLAEAIVEYADDFDANSFVLGTKRRPDKYRALRGSVTDRVLGLTTRPWTVVRTEVCE